MKTNHLLKQISKNRFFYYMLIPIAVYFLLFNYYPLILGFYSSFMQSKILGGNKFIGFANYKDVFTQPDFPRAFYNSVVIGFFTFALQFVWGLLLALALAETRRRVFRSAVQTFSYLPYLLSWAVVGGIWMSMLSTTGLVNGLLQFLGLTDKQIVFMAEPSIAKLIMILSGAWKGAGYSAVLLLAGIVSIDTSIYEAASIDGASRMRQIRTITIPLLSPTMKVVIVLGAMSILRNFDQIYIMQNAAILDQIRTLSYLIFNTGITNLKIGFATACASVVLVATWVINTVVRKAVKYDQIYQ